MHKIKAEFGEKAQYLVRNYNDNTIRFLVSYEGIVNGDILKEAVRYVVESIDILHSSFYVSSNKAYWIENIDLDIEAYYKTYKVDDIKNAITDIEKVFVEAINHNSQNQIKCTLFRDDKESVVIVNMSHLCVDGGDGRYLLLKIIETYNALNNEEKLDSVEIKQGSRAFEQVFNKFSKKDWKAFSKMPKKKDKTDIIQSEFPYATKDSGEKSVVRVILDEDIVKSIGQKAKKYNGTINDALLTAFYYAFDKIIREKGSISKDDKLPMTIMSMMDLRRHCITGDSLGISNMSGAMQTNLPSGISDTYEDTFKLIVEQTRVAKEDKYAGLYGMPMAYKVMKYMPYGLVNKIVKKIYTSKMSLGLTNMGNINKEKLCLGNLYAKYISFGGPLKKKPGMQISVISVDGKLSLCVVGEYTGEDKKVIEKFLYDMIEYMK